MTLELIAVGGLPEVRAGDDLAALLERSLVEVGTRDGDVLAVTQKIVSKAEGRLVPARDRTGWIERESVGLVARRGDVVIVRTRHGFVCANAGVDASNVPAGLLTLLPEDPDASAERLQKELCARLGVRRLGVVITDTFGRPWREGVVDVAIGCAGLPPLLDLRGTRDDRGRGLETTVVALADAVAAASGLVMGKAARVRPTVDDLFRESALVAVAAARPTDRFAAPGLAAGSLDDAVRAASRGVAPLLAVATSSAALRRLRAAAHPSQRPALAAATAAVVPCLRAADGVDEAGSLRVGAAIGRLTVALRAQGIGWAWEPEAPLDAELARTALDLAEGWLPVAIVAVGPPPEG